MVLGLGLELLRLDDVRRILAESGRGFAESTWTDAERAHCEARAEPVPGLAARLAAKRAAIEALGRPADVALVQVEVVAEPSGRPSLRLSGRAREVAESLGVRSLHVTLTHAETHAMAWVLLEGDRA